MLTALLFAAALVLALVEGALPPLPVPAPGVRLGLSNIAVMYTLLFVGAWPALCIAVLKAGFVLLLRGTAVGALLSLAGGVLSVCGMLALKALSRGRCSVFLLSLCGAVLHNVGQYAAISLLYTGVSMAPYLPVLLVAGLCTGLFTSVLLRAVLPALRRVLPDKTQNERGNGHA